MAWSEWQELGSGSKISSGVGVASWSIDRLDCFARNPQNHLVHLWNDHGTWSGWQDLGGDGVCETPGAISWQAGRIDCLVRGSQNAMWHKWYDNGWSGWQYLSGNLMSGVAVASWTPDRLDCFARGTDNALWHAW
jgi:hypothetical protein